MVVQLVEKFLVGVEVPAVHEAVAVGQPQALQCLEQVVEGFPLPLLDEPGLLLLLLFRLGRVDGQFLEFIHL